MVDRFSHELIVELSCFSQISKNCPFIVTLADMLSKHREKFRFTSSALSTDCIARIVLRCGTVQIIKYAIKVTLGHPILLKINVNDRSNRH